MPSKSSYWRPQTFLSTLIETSYLLNQKVGVHRPQHYQFLQLLFVNQINRYRKENNTISPVKKKPNNFFLSDTFWHIFSMKVIEYYQYRCFFYRANRIRCGYDFWYERTLCVLNLVCQYDILSFLLMLFCCRCGSVELLRMAYVTTLCFVSFLNSWFHRRLLFI